VELVVVTGEAVELVVVTGEAVELVEVTGEAVELVVVTGEAVELVEVTGQELEREVAFTASCLSYSWLTASNDIPANVLILKGYIASVIFLLFSSVIFLQ
jgi:hypothetical protein